MTSSRIVLMGDPTYFSIRGGANPHTRTVWGRRKRVDREQAIAQWHAFARTLCRFGVRVLVIPSYPKLPGLVYPANAGFVFPLDTPIPLSSKTFYLSNLLPSRAGEQPVYKKFLEQCGLCPMLVNARFEGEADFFPAGAYYLFTYGRLERQRFRLRFGLPPYKRVYGFRSDFTVLSELQQRVADTEIIPLELRNEAHYHGDTVLCAFGPGRRFLLAYLDGLTSAAAACLRDLFQGHLISLSCADAALYAANSFTLEQNGRASLFMPDGVSQALQAQVRERGAEPVLVNVSEFLRKGGGAVKCMIGDLGPDEEVGLSPAQRTFRQERDYRNLFATVGI